MRTIVGMLIVAAWLALPSTAAAQTAKPQADKWSPWLGCWALTTENVLQGRGAARASALSSREQRAQPDDPSVPHTCVTRSGDGVTITTIVPGQTPITQTVVADGSPHDISDGECHGVERTEWSNSGMRLVAHADVKCSDQAPRTLTGLGLITRDGEWLDIRSFRIDGNDATRVSRYHRVTGAIVREPELTVGEIKELSSKVSSSVVEAAIAETRPHVTVNRRVLLDLADTQVPTNVIDVMVAVAYPDRFIIEEPISQGPQASAGSPGFAPIAGIDPFDPFWPYYYPAYYYSPLAYGYLGRYNPLYDGIVYGGGDGAASGGGGGGSSKPAESGLGRVVNGQGYTRIHPNDAAPAHPVSASRSGNGTQAIRSSNDGASSNSGASTSAPAPAPPPSDSGSSSSSSSGGGGGGGGGATASPQGFSSGGGGESTGRTAVPR
jgi:hypothetical protein